MICHAHKKISSGIYQIKNKINGKLYIGSAVDLLKRKSHHFWHLRKGIHGNGHLQSAYNKYGHDAFSFEILLFCDRKDLVFYEQTVIDGFATHDRDVGYNLRIIANTNAGTKRTLEQREASRKLRASSEYLNKVMKSKTGNRHNCIVLQKFVERRKGHPYWLVKCDCGKEYVAELGSIVSGNIISCGCFKRKPGRNNFGLAQTKEYRRWIKLRAKKLLCPKWEKSFILFRDSIGQQPEAHNLIRENRNEVFSDANYKWVINKEARQSNGNYKFVTVDGAIMNLSDASKKIGISTNSIYARINRYGESHQQAIDYYIKKRESA